MTTLTTNAARDHADLGADLDRVEAWLARDVEVLTRVVPAVSGWEIARHLFHLSLANELSLKNALALVNRKGLLIRPRQPLAAEASAVLEAGAIPRGLAQAPRFVTPPATFEPESVQTFARDARQLHEQVGRRLDELADAPDGIPHQLLGDLSAPLWLRFARTHTAHHLAIIDEIAAAPD